MAIKIDPDDLNQGLVDATPPTDLVFGAPTGNQVTITSALNLIPAFADNEFFEIRDHSQAVNNGLYQVNDATPAIGNVTVDKVSGANPITAGAETVAILGGPGAANEKSIFYDTAAREVYLLEQGNLDGEGATGQAVYSRMMIDWKDDNFLIANAPFPMFTIDADAGKYLIGQDASGNNNGWNWRDNSAFGIRTRKLLRNAGWSEINSAGLVTAQHAGIGTLGTFDAPARTGGDQARFQFGTDTTVDDTVAFEFTGPVNEAIQVFDATVSRADAVTGYAVTTTDTISRNDGGDFATDGYKVGGQAFITDAEDAGNNGTHLITAVNGGVNGSIVVSSTLTNNAADTTMTIAVDNRNALKLTLRVQAKTYGQANLASGGHTVLSNRFFTFPLANGPDLDIVNSDAEISGGGAIAPYTTMALEIYATGQSRGGPGADALVGGPFNFGFIITTGVNSPTDQQAYTFIQWALRQTVDVDAEGVADAIGVTLDGLMGFVGSSLKIGTTDDGLTFPTNPQGGGSGVFVEGLAAASRNSTDVFDNLNTRRGYPIGTPVTLDFNDTLINDTVAEYTLFFDHTIRNVISDLVITAGTGSSGTFNSAGSNLPTAIDGGDGQYIRISGLTGGDAAMNGIYQVNVTTSALVWSVTRYDGATIVTTASASLNVDEHPIDSPSHIIVQDNSPADVAGLASADFPFTFDYSNNVQGGRTAATDALVRARAIGQASAQYTQSTLQTIESGIALTIPVSSQIERNFNNPP